MTISQADNLPLKSFLWPKSLTAAEIASMSGLLSKFYSWRYYFTLATLGVVGLFSALFSIDNLFRLNNLLIGIVCALAAMLFIGYALLAWRRPKYSEQARRIVIWGMLLIFGLSCYGNGVLPFVFATVGAVFFYFLDEIREAFVFSVLLIAGAITGLLLSPLPIDAGIVSRQMFELVVSVPALHFIFCFARWMSDLYAEKLRSRTKFASTISHEIRSPLNGLVGLLSIAKDLNDQPLSEVNQAKVRECLARMGDLQEHLAAVVNNSLLISQLKGGNLTQLNKPTKVSTFLASTVETFRGACDEKGIELEFYPMSSCIELVSNIDPLRTRQLLFNLLSNAVKYTDNGRIEVQADVREMGSQTYLHVSVKDTGLGIPEDKQYRVFEEFTQFHHQEEHLSTGTGLGLSLVKELTTALGGQCGFTSSFGFGSIFWFTVPIDVPIANALTPNDAKENRSLSTGAELMTDSLIGLRALIVDDESINRRVISTLLTKKGVEVQTASNGLEALSTIRDYEAHFDIIFLDQQMPTMDGVQTLRRIRALPAYTTTPILCITGAVHEEIEGAQEFSEFLQKPIKPEILWAKTAYHCLVARLGKAEL